MVFEGIYPDKERRSRQSLRRQFPAGLLEAFTHLCGRGGRRRDRSDHDRRSPTALDSANFDVLQVGAREGLFEALPLARWRRSVRITPRKRRENVAGVDGRWSDTISRVFTALLRSSIGGFLVVAAPAGEKDQDDQAVAQPSPRRFCIYTRLTCSNPRHAARW